MPDGLKPGPMSGLAQAEVEGRGLVDFPFRPDAASVPLDDPANDRQAGAGPFELLAAVQAMKHAKEFFTHPR